MRKLHPRLVGACSKNSRAMFDPQHVKRPRGETQAILAQRLVYGARRRWADLARSLNPNSSRTNSLTLWVTGHDLKSLLATTLIFVSRIGRGPFPTAWPPPTSLSVPGYTCPRGKKKKSSHTLQCQPASTR